MNPCSMSEKGRFSFLAKIIHSAQNSSVSPSIKREDKRKKGYSKREEEKRANRQLQPTKNTQSNIGRSEERE